MMNTPRLRAWLTAWFMRGAISPTRRVEPSHQCLSHISQMTMAVPFGFHSTDFSTLRHSPLPLLVSTRARVARDNELEASAAKLPAALPPRSAAMSRKKSRFEQFIGLPDGSDARQFLGQHLPNN